MSVYVLPGFLSAAECDQARALFPALAPASVNLDDASREVKESVRRSRVAFATGPESRELSGKLWQLLQHANERAFQFELAGTEHLQLAEYAEGEGYHWHLDLGPGSASRRKLSLSVQLSPPGDYDGGDLEIWGSGKVDRDQGTAIVFPSYLLHRVAPVTRGARRSLVAWAVGDQAFR